MPRFEVGQKVKCISMPQDYANKLEIGQIYTVSRIRTVAGDNEVLYVQENNSSHWYIAGNFEPVSEKLNATNKRVKWTLESLKAEAAKFKTRTEFSRYGNTAYSAAGKMGVLEQITTHMPQRFYDRKKVESENDGKKLFVRYPNRKLYDTVNSKYVTLADIMATPIGSFKVLDSKNKKDITESVLIQGLASVLRKQPEKFELIKMALIEKDIFKGTSNA